MTGSPRGEPERPDASAAVVVSLALFGGVSGPAAALVHEAGWFSMGPPATLWPLGVIVLAALVGLLGASRVKGLGARWLGLVVALVNGLVLIPYLFLLLFFGLGGSR